MWFSASLLLKAAHEGEAQPEPLWEETIVLLQARDETDATVQAEQLGKSKEHEYEVAEPSRHLVKWKFVRVERVCSIDEEDLGSGTELFSRFLRSSEVASLLTPFGE